MPKRSSRKGSGATQTDDESKGFAVQPGQIFWIPRKEKAIGDLGLKYGAYNHPCVVLSDVDCNGKCAILIMTSLGGENLIDKGFAPGFREKLLPVSPTAPHPDHGKLLHLRHGHDLNRNSYVNTSRWYQVKFEYLERFPDGIRHFTNESFDLILKMSGFSPQIRSKPDSHSDDASSDGIPTRTHIKMNVPDTPRILYTEDKLRSLRAQHAVKTPTDLEHALKTLNIFKDPSPSSYECQGCVRSTPVPHPPEFASSSPSHVLASAARVLPGSSTIPSLSRQTVHSTPYAHGGITPLPFQDSIHVPQPASKHRSAANSSKYSETSPLLPVHIQDAQSESVETYQEIEPESSSTKSTRRRWLDFFLDPLLFYRALCSDECNLPCIGGY